AGQPLVQLYLELRLQGARVRAGTHTPDEIEPGQARIPETRGWAGDQWLRREREPDVGHVGIGDLGAEETGPGHAGNRERMAIEIERRSDHAGVGPVPRL